MMQHSSLISDEENKWQVSYNFIMTDDWVEQMFVINFVTINFSTLKGFIWILTRACSMYLFR